MWALWKVCETRKLVKRSAVDVEITPQPTEDERRAILKALEEERRTAAAPSPWHRAGLGPGPEDEADQAVAPPRQRRGATRA